MPIEENDADQGDDAEFSTEHQQCQHRTDTRRRQRRQDRDRMDVALIQDAKHDVDSDERGRESNTARWRSTAGMLARCLKVAVDRGRDANPIHRIADGSHGVAEGRARREVKRHRRRHEQAVMVDSKRSAAGPERGETRKAAPSFRHLR